MGRAGQARLPTRWPRAGPLPSPVVAGRARPVPPWIRLTRGAIGDYMGRGRGVGEGVAEREKWGIAWTNALPWRLRQAPCP
jgi:hypothetical protein